jgi:hypothetical protein
MKKYTLFFAMILLSTNLFAQTNEKKGYIGMTLGPSYPILDFADNSINNVNAGFARRGYSNTLINFGYRFGKNLGISASVFYSQYDVYQSATDIWWAVSGITAGPMLTIPVTDKLFLDMKTNFGFVAADYVIEGLLYNENAGRGLGIDIRTSIRYNLFKRWCFIIEGGFLSSNQKYLDAREMKIQNINLIMGIAFRI